MSEPERDNAVLRRRATIVDSAAGAAIAAGVFFVIAAGLMIHNAYRMRDVNLLDCPELTALRSAVRADPENADIQQRFREADRRVRIEYFQRRDFSHRGAWLLIGSLAAAVGALQLRHEVRKRLPDRPGADPGVGQARRAARRSRWSVAAVGGALCGVLLGWAAGIDRADLAALRDAIVAGGGSGSPPAGKAPTTAQAAGNWPRFRGPGGGGVWTHGDVPASWNGPSGEGVLWKSPVPLPGKNSPVIWGKHVFLTGANESRREVYCFDADTGKRLWTQPVFVAGGPTEKPNVMEDDTGFAAPSAVTDGRYVCVMFANGDLACFDVAGKRIWAQSLGLPDNSYGHASSPLIWQDRLIVLFDQGADDDDESSLLAFSLATGDEVWSTDREMANSWGSPIAITAAGRDQIITGADPWVIAYDPRDGSEIWRAKCLGGEQGPSPIFAGGLVYTVNTEAPLAAIRPDGADDVTATHCLWRADATLPEICSPVSNGQRVWILVDSDLTCFDAKTGKKLYEHEFEASFVASPSLAGGKLYLLSESGIMHVVAAGEKFELLHKSPLGEKTYASPAFGKGRIYLRGAKHLYCVGK